MVKLLCVFIRSLELETVLENRNGTSKKGTIIAITTVCILVFLIALAAIALFIASKKDKTAPSQSEPRLTEVERLDGVVEQVDLNKFYPAESEVLTYDSDADYIPLPSGYTEVVTGLEDATLDVGSGLTLISVGTYSGKYVEDGSDVYVDNVMSVTVRNDGEQDIQMATVFVSIDNVFCEFTITTLPRGAAAVVFEKNKHQYTASGVVKYAYATDVIYFVNDVSTESENVSITAWNGYINIANISGSDIEGELTVYYKSYAAGQYFGGITYVARAENGIPSGESVTLHTPHFIPGSSKVMFVIYDGAADGE